MNSTCSKPTVNQYTRLCLPLSCPPHTPHTLKGPSAGHLSEWTLQVPGAEAFHMHCFLLVSLFWWHLFPENTFTCCSLYNKYYVWFLVNKNLIAAKVVSGRQKNILHLPAPPQRVGRNGALGIWKENPVLLSLLSYCCNDQEFLACGS